MARTLRWEAKRWGESRNENSSSRRKRKEGFNGGRPHPIPQSAAGNTEGVGKVQPTGNALGLASILMTSNTEGVGQVQPSNAFRNDTKSASLNTEGVGKFQPTGNALGMTTMPASLNTEGVGKFQPTGNALGMTTDPRVP